MQADQLHKVKKYRAGTGELKTWTRTIMAVKNVACLFLTLIIMNLGEKIKSLLCLLNPWMQMAW